MSGKVKSAICYVCGQPRSVKRKARNYIHPKCRSKRKKGIKRVIPRAQIFGTPYWV